MDKKKLIAVITNNDDDIYCFRKELIERLIDEDFEILISCPFGPKFDLMKDISFQYDNVFIDRRGTNVIKDTKLFLHYIKLFYEKKPDIVMTYTAKPNVYASMAARICKIPYINNVTGIGSVVNMSGMKKRFVLGLFKCAYRNAECIMFQNETNMKLAIDMHMVRNRYRLIPGSGVNTDRFCLQDYPNAGNGKIGDKVIFNYIGRVMHDKGVDDYIEAAKIIKKEYPNVEFNMLGFIEPSEIHYESELRELEKQGVIMYRGNQADVKPWIGRAHAIIHPSTYGEGMSNVLLENASSGRVIITTDNPGCMETVIDNKSGYIYQGKNVDKLIECIIKFLNLNNEKRKKMGIIGREYVSQKFSREIVIGTYIDEIKIILGENRK